MTNTEPRWVRRTEARAYLGVSDATLYRYVAAGIVPKHSISGTTRYDLNELDAVLRSGSAAPVRRCCDLYGIGDHDPTEHGTSTAADVIARIRTELPAGKPLIPLVQVHAILDKVAAELGVEQ